MRRNISTAIDEIACDTRAGAAEILRRAARVFSLLEQSVTNQDDHRQLVLETCIALIHSQPSMAPLSNLANAVAQAVSGETMNRAEEAARRFIENAERAVRDASLHAARLMKENSGVLTHSRSSTVMAAFRAALDEGRKFHVIATESRPLLEGRTLARELLNSGIAVTLIADMAAALVIDEVDFVLVGADRITPHHIVNKIGTRMIALAAAERNVPVYAIADSTKFIDFPADREVARDVSEIWEDAPASVEIVNRYFEPVPTGLFTSIITEDGALGIEEARRRAAAASLDPRLTELLEAR